MQSKKQGNKNMRNEVSKKLTQQMREIRSWIVQIGSHFDEKAIIIIVGDLTLVLSHTWW